jgi:hypothetical protein
MAQHRPSCAGGRPEIKDIAMAYSAEISQANPTCFLFLVDQSGSMGKRFGPQASCTKAEGVADAINRLISTLVSRCEQGEYILNRYYIGVIGYGEDVGLGFPIDALASEVLQPVEQVCCNPLRTGDAYDVWLEPKAQGKTRMCSAFEAARELIGDFIARHPTCYPPIVINISDGAATDGDPTPMAMALQGLASQDGNVLLLNIHISDSAEAPVVFPADDRSLPDDYARAMFRISSPLPASMIQLAQGQEVKIDQGARGFAFNADLTALVGFLDIGTRVGRNVD